MSTPLPVPPPQGGREPEERPRYNPQGSRMRIGHRLRWWKTRLSSALKQAPNGYAHDGRTACPHRSLPPCGGRTGRGVPLTADSASDAVVLEHDPEKACP